MSAPFSPFLEESASLYLAIRSFTRLDWQTADPRSAMKHVVEAIQSRAHKHVGTSIGPCKAMLVRPWHLTRSLASLPLSLYHSSDKPVDPAATSQFRLQLSMQREELLVIL